MTQRPNSSLDSKEPAVSKTEDTHQVMNATKRMLVVFCDIPRVMHCEFTQGQISNADYYCYILRCLRENIWLKNLNCGMLAIGLSSMTIHPLRVHWKRTSFSAPTTIRQVRQFLQ